jgi:hypothetical protein
MVLVQHSKELIFAHTGSAESSDNTVRSDKHQTNIFNLCQNIVQIYPTGRYSGQFDRVQHQNFVRNPGLAGSGQFTLHFQNTVFRITTD